MIFDLHGLTESEAVLRIDSILWQFEESNEDNIEIITGNGIVLKDILIEELDNKGFLWKYKKNNSGSLIIYK